MRLLPIALLCLCAPAIGMDFEAPPALSGLGAKWNQSSPMMEARETDKEAAEAVDFDLPPRPPLLPSVKFVDPPALIRAAAAKHRVPAAFLKSIMAAESNFDADAISRCGAIGLMQLMPATAELYGADPHVPEQNVDAAARYLRYLMDRYKGRRDRVRRVIAAYNAGPGAVDRYRGVLPYRETRQYVTRVLTFLRRFQRAG
jgi:soluble lytic murein transglycosylase-like protein